jgi:Cu/Ag efflux protein CusF
MIARLYRSLLLGLVWIALTGLTSREPASAERGTAEPLGIDLGGPGPAAAIAHPQAPTRAALGDGDAYPPQQEGEMQMAHAGPKEAHGTGTVNAIEPAQHRLNLSLGPIPELGWPALTLDFLIADSVDLEAIDPGTRVNFTIERVSRGIYEIRAISPVGDGR